MSEAAQLGLGIAGQLKRRIGNRILAEDPEQKKKRRKPFAANNASKKFLTEQGWFVDRVEQRIPHCFTTRDLYNFGDLLGMKEGEKHLIVQATSAAHMRDRLLKVRAEPRAALWLATGGRIAIHGWFEAGRIGQRKQWRVKVMEVTRIEAELPLPFVAPKPPGGVSGEKAQSYRKPGGRA